MKKHFFAILLSSSCLLPAAMAMEAAIEHIDPQTTRKHHHLIQPGMVVLEGAFHPNNNTKHLTVLGNNDQPIFECDVLIKTINEIIINRYGTLYVAGNKEDVSNTLIGHGEAIQRYVRVDTIVRVKENEKPQSLNLGSTYDNISILPDGTLYVSRERTEDHALLRVKEDGDPKPLPLETFELRQVHNMKFTPDGTLYVKGRDENTNNIIVRMKEDGKSQTITPEDLGLTSINLAMFSPDGTLYIQGIDQNSEYVVARVKEDEKLKPANLLSLGVKYLPNAFPPMFNHCFSPDGTLYMWRIGQDDKNQTTIIRVKENEQPQLLKLELKILPLSFLNFSPDGTFYVAGKDQHNQHTILRVKGDEKPQTLNLGLKRQYDIRFSPDGTLYATGKGVFI